LATRSRRKSEEPQYSLWTRPPGLSGNLTGLNVPNHVEFDRERLENARATIGERFKAYRTPVTDAALRQSAG